VSEEFFYKINLPFSKKVINFKELTTKNQLEIEKINHYYPSSIEYYMEYHNNFLKVLKRCVENFEEVLSLDIIEYLLLCLKLRITSIGNVLELQIKSDNSKVKFTKISLDLQDILKNILLASENSLVNRELIYEDKGLTIKFGWPDIKSIKNFHNLFFSTLSFQEKVLMTIPEFIKEIEVNNDIIDFKNLNFDQKEKMLLNFPASIKNDIQKAVLENINNLSNYDIFEISYFKDQKLNFYNLIYIELIKLIFSQNPKRIYEEIYILSNFNMSSEYVLNMSPSERKIYLSFIEAQKKSQNPTSEPSSIPVNNGNNRSLEDLSVEFGDLPPN
jgi:hypothetical protein